MKAVMKKAISMLLVVAMAVSIMVLPGCSKSGGSKEELNLFVWTEYASAGHRHLYQTDRNQSQRDYVLQQ